MNKLVLLCANHRKFDENAMDYVDYMDKEFDKFNVSEEAKIKILAMNVWPHRQAFKDDLASVKNM